MKRLPKVATEMALRVLAYHLTRNMKIMSVQPLLAVMRVQLLLQGRLGTRDYHHPNKR
jgi:hypothetical protein